MGESSIIREEYIEKVLSAYFFPVIEEVLSLRVSPHYFQHLRHKIERLTQTR